VRDVIEPGRNLGHVDKDYSRNPAAAAAAAAAAGGDAAGTADQTEEGQRDPTKVQETPPLPRPRDMAAKAHTLTHPPDAPQPSQREWGSREGDRRVPAGVVGGTKPAVPEPDAYSAVPGQKDEQMKIEDGDAQKCEDCA
jgi:hypothetical protein